MSVRVLEGDCRDTMRSLIADGVRVQTIVTSPPYFGLRDYGCEGQIGLEASPAEFIAQLVEVFDVARDLLADDGTLWVNMGDSYAANRTYQVHNSIGAEGHTHSPGSKVPVGLKPKDLIGIPWRLAFALQAAGWYLRQDIIWSKPNPMPESVTDRCTKAHEYIFLLSKSRRYYFDAPAIGEPANFPGGPGNIKPAKGAGSDDDFMRTREGVHLIGARETRNKRSVWTVPTQPFGEAHFATFPPALIAPCILAGSRLGDRVLDPFGGAGTTGLVADRFGRDAILCELNPEYAAMARRRIAGHAPLFVDVI